MSEHNRKLQPPELFITPSEIIFNENLQHLDGHVYAIIYWYTKMKMEKCIAKNATIAQLIRSTEGSVKNSIARLVKEGYVESIYHREKHLRELVPKLTMRKDSTSSKNDVARHQMMPSTSSKNDFVYSMNKNNKQNSVLDKKLLKEETPAYKKKEYLLTIPTEDVQALINDIGCTKEDIIKKGKALYYWLEENGKTRKNYKAWLKSRCIETLKKSESVMSKIHWAN